MKNIRSLIITAGLLLLLGLPHYSYARDPEPHEVILYEHANFSGSYIILSRDRTVDNISYWHTDSGQSWNDKISSLKVGRTTKVILYADKLSQKNGGASITFQGNCSSIKEVAKLSSYNWNDRATGLKVQMADCYD